MEFNMSYAELTSPSVAIEAASSTLDGGPKATVVTGKARLKFLPKVFGPRHFLTGEAGVYRWMRALCQTYKGGSWNFYNLSNGGFYLALDDGGNGAPLHLSWHGNGFDGVMACDAAGIAVTLFSLCHLAIETQEERFGDQYHLLRDFASHHAERRAIFSLID